MNVSKFWNDSGEPCKKCGHMKMDFGEAHLPCAYCWDAGPMVVVPFMPHLELKLSSGTVSPTHRYYVMTFKLEELGGMRFWSYIPQKSSP